MARDLDEVFGLVRVIGPLVGVWLFSGPLGFERVLLLRNPMRTFVTQWDVRGQSFSGLSAENKVESDRACLIVSSDRQ
jgi:hypothetical protein